MLDRRIATGAFVFVALVLLPVLATLSVIGSRAALAQEKLRRVLILNPYNNLYPASVMAGEAARKRLAERSGEPLEVFTDFLDLGRFSGQAYEARIAQHLAEKYRDYK